MSESKIKLLTAASTPRHVAVIMDGNGRWAKARRRPRFMGHKAGVESVRTVVNSCVDSGVEVLTLFAFSSENWRRPEEEVGALMSLFATVLEREVKKLHKSNVSLRIIGELNAFTPKMQKLIEKAESLTANNTGLILVIAANYGGRWDIAQATMKLAYQVERGELGAADINPERVAEMLSLADLPEPDLFIRTGGEKRISNFLLWQLAYTELYFTDTLWPDFKEEAFNEALLSFAQRQRRFGKTGDQIEQEKK
ncbi:MAG: isoprenyl transferase [Gammaproteobacteria bacterium]|nr:isoprenyl transferase [Gammaproteobacteria bacterium]MCF6229819.1 isoprenyl transferase [Gammaproteobacteria bacterium]